MLYYIFVFFWTIHDNICLKNMGTIKLTYNIIKINMEAVYICLFDGLKYTYKNHRSRRGRNRSCSFHFELSQDVPYPDDVMMPNRKDNWHFCTSS